MVSYGIAPCYSLCLPSCFNLCTSEEVPEETELEGGNMLDDNGGADIEDMTCAPCFQDPQPKAMLKVKCSPNTFQDTAGIDKTLCPICTNNSKHGSMGQCKPCMADVVAANNDADANGWRHNYDERAKNEATFRQMILAYACSCPGRGRGVPRGEFDTIAFCGKYTQTNV